MEKQAVFERQFVACWVGHVCHLHASAKFHGVFTPLVDDSMFIWANITHNERGSPTRKADLAMHCYGPYPMLGVLSYGPYPMRECGNYVQLFNVYSISE